MSLSASQVRAIAPNIHDELFLWRPTRSEPPLASRHELATVYHLDHLLDMNEMIDLEEHLAAKVADQAGRPER